MPAALLDVTTPCDDDALELGTPTALDTATDERELRELIDTEETAALDEDAPTEIDDPELATLDRDDEDELDGGGTTGARFEVHSIALRIISTMLGSEKFSDTWPIAV